MAQAPKSPLDTSSVTRIVKSGHSTNPKPTGLQPFSFDPVNIPGRPKSKSEQEHDKLLELLDLFKKKDVENSSLLAKAEIAKKALYQKGLAEGEALADEKYNAAVNKLERNLQVLLQQVSSEKEKIFLQFEGEALTLVSHCVQKVFEHVADSETEIILPILRKAVAALGPTSAIIVRVNPHDFETAKEGQSLWQSLEGQLRDVRIESDTRVTPGGCLVESDCASVGLNLQEMLARLDNDLLQAWENKNRMQISSVAEISVSNIDASESEI